MHQPRPKQLAQDGAVVGQALVWNGTKWTPGAPAAGSAQLQWGNNSVVATTTTRYLTPGFDNGDAETSAIQIRMTRAGTFRNLYVRHNVLNGNGEAIVYTFRKNGIAQSLSVSLASDAPDASDLVHSFAVAAGDLIDIEVTKALGVGTSPRNIIATVEFV